LILVRSVNISHFQNKCRLINKIHEDEGIEGRLTVDSGGWKEESDNIWAGRIIEGK